MVTPVLQGDPPVLVDLSRTYVLDDNGNVLSATRQIDVDHFQTRAWTYDDSGNILTETDPLSDSSTVTTTNAYNTNNSILTTSVVGSASSALRLTTAYAYDSAGHTSCKIQNPTIAANTITCSVDGTNLPPSTLDTNIVTAYAYDNNDMLVKSVDPLGTITMYAYTPRGMPATTTRNYVIGSGTPDLTNLMTTYTYDNAGNLLTQTDPVTYFPPARTTTTTYTYDLMGSQLTKSTPGDTWVPGRETVNKYDEFGALVSLTTCTFVASADGCATGVLSQATETRDELDRSEIATDVTPAHDAAQATTTTTRTRYDFAGNAYSSQRDDQAETIRTFDSLGRTYQETTPNGTTTHFYDGLGNEIKTVVPASISAANPAGIQTTVRTYRPSGTIATSTTDGGTLTYLYDAIGRQIGAVDASGLSVSSTTYDLLGRVLSSTVTNKVMALDGTSSNVTTTVDTTYDRAGNVLTVTAPYQGTQTKLTTTNLRDALGRVYSVTDGAGLVTRIYFNAAGNAIGTVAPDHSVSRVIYDVFGNAVETIANCSDDYILPTNSPQTSQCGLSLNGWNIRTTSSTEASAGRIVGRTTVGTLTRQTTTDGEGRIVQTIVDPDGAHLQTDYAYDSKGRLVAQTTPAPSGRLVNSTWYDDFGRVVDTIADCHLAGSDSDPGWSDCDQDLQDGTHNLDTSYYYDNAGNLSQKVAPSGAITHYTYDAAGRPASTWINDGPATIYYYDSAGRNVAVSKPTDSGSFTVARYAYDSLGHVVAQLANCSNSPSGTPPVGDAAKTCAGDGLANAYTNVLRIFAYDTRGNLVSQTSPSPTGDAGSAAMATKLYAYDSANRLCRALQNAVGVTPSQLTCTGNLPNGVLVNAATNVSTQYTYDDAGNLASQVVTTDPTTSWPGITSYVYNGSGQLAGKTDAKEKITRFTYDANGNKATETDNDTTGGATVAWFYDSAGRLCRRVAAAQNSHLGDLSLDDPCGDQDEIGEVDGAAIDTHYRYDRASNVKQVSDWISGQAINALYDDDARPVAVWTTLHEAAPIDWTDYCYGTPCGSLSGPLDQIRSDPSGTYAFSFDDQGRERSLVNPQNPTGDPFTWTYSPAGRLTSLSEPVASGPSHLVTAYAYDPLGRLSSKITAREVGGASIASYSYAYNAAGNQLSQTTNVQGGATNGTASYAYDALSRLTNYTPAGDVPSQVYGWNSQPDRATIKVGTADALRTYFDAASRPSEANGYASDGEGRLTGVPGQTLVYDTLGRLTEVDDPTQPLHPAIATYQYDPLDRLVSEHIAATDKTIKYVYVGLTTTIAQVIDGSTIINHANDANGTELYEWSDGNPVSYVGTNGHGDLTWTATPAAITNGTTSTHGDYDPFGKILAGSTLQTAASWQGSIYDSATSLYYVVARWYSPALGRFTSNDPAAGRITDPSSLNPYAYAAGDPIGGSDPSGRTTCYGTYCPTGGSDASVAKTPLVPPKPTAKSAAKPASSSSGSSGITCYDGYCHAAGGAATPSSIASEKILQQMLTEQASQRAAVAAGCPIGYCGTAEQKAKDAELDTNMAKILGEEARSNAARASALSGGCPVAYCGTADQKATDAAVDAYVGVTFKAIVAQAKADADAEAAKQHKDCGFMGVGCANIGLPLGDIGGGGFNLDLGGAWNGVTNAVGGAWNNVVNSDALKIVAIVGIVGVSWIACVGAASLTTCGAAFGATGGLVGSAIGGGNLNAMLVATAGGAILGATTGGMGVIPSIMANGAGAGALNVAEQYANSGSIDPGQAALAAGFGGIGGGISSLLAPSNVVLAGFDEFAVSGFGSMLVGMAGSGLLTDPDKAMPWRIKN